MKSNFLEYTKALMASQLELSDDLHNDHQQATNVYFEAASHSLNQVNQQQKNIDTKDCSTQTINSKLNESFMWIYKFNSIVLVSREEKSLGIMSQKFLMLFLTSEVNLIFID